jgi:hypothetical protein
MAIAREEAHAQRQMMAAQSQMMNAMFMSMLNKNGGDSSSPPSSTQLGNITMFVLFQCVLTFTTVNESINFKSSITYKTKHLHLRSIQDAACKYFVFD